MDELLDSVWFKIVAIAQSAVHFMDTMMSPLDVLGPGPVIFLLALATVCFTKLFRRFYTTKRYQKLKAEFDHWMHVRKEAMAAEDREKGKRLARNIDQAKLNRLYYDYFFEGFLKNILTTILPILLMAAYINEAYNPDKLSSRFGGRGFLSVPGIQGESTAVSPLMWYLAAIVSVYVLWAVGKMFLRFLDKR